MLLIKRIWFVLTHPTWKRLDKFKPEYHQPCDVIEIQYGVCEIGSLYETSIIPNLSYEGFVGKLGLFVSPPKLTYWQPSVHAKPVFETTYNGWVELNKGREVWCGAIRWGGE